MLFQHTAARRRLGYALGCFGGSQHVSTHSRPKAAGCKLLNTATKDIVSTHSRPKAAGQGRCWQSPRRIRFQHTAARRRLGRYRINTPFLWRFNTQPPEGGWTILHTLLWAQVCVSTHSRPKAAGPSHPPTRGGYPVSTHSRPKAAGPIDSVGIQRHGCFNTQPPEGGWNPFP